MHDIKLLSITIRNFMGIKELHIDFGDSITNISGRNASCKSSVFHAFTWTMFNKNSEGSEKFMIRPVDKDGNQIHNIDIEVIINLLVDGKKYSIRKVQKENWVRKRGESESELKGSQNKYFVNEAEKKESEFKAFIADIIKEDDFRLLTNLSFFANMDAKKRRQLLLDLCGDISDGEMLDSDADHWMLIREAVLSMGVDDAKTVAKRRLSALKSRQEELPTRIDEATRRIQPEPNVEPIRAEKATVAVALDEAKDAVRKLMESNPEVELKKEKLDIQQKLTELTNQERNVLLEKKQALRKVLDEKSDAARKCNEVLVNCEAEKSILDQKMQMLLTQREDLTAKYHEAKGRMFDERQTICPTCGQSLQANKIAIIKDNFELKKKQDVEEIMKNGFKAKEQIGEVMDLINACALKLTDAKAKLSVASKDAEEARSQYDSFSTEPDMSQNPDFKAYLGMFDEVQTKLQNNTYEADLQAAMDKKASLQGKLYELEKEIASADAISKANIETHARIEELTNEQRLVGQQIASAEQAVILLEQFSTEKSKKLEEKVNQYFQLARFELFEKQINGGMKEICEISYNGVKYGSLNSGHRIAVGLDIIKTFQKHFGVKCPVWVDNAESINSFNIPGMDCQMILLSVSEEDTLNVRVA